jgi:uncharacterized protein
MPSSLNRIDHRPWPMPSGRWSWRQSWVDLLFLHWPVPSELLRPLVPAGLTIQEFEGTSWVGVVPFRMEGVMRRPFPDVPGLSAFPELNVRLYVEAEGRPGVWFLSLDATNPLAVWAARRFFHLPYHRAHMSLTERAGWYEYESHRRSAEASFRARYRPLGAQYESRAGTLEHWLTERYCLYALSPTGQLLRNEVHHVPWPLYRAEAELMENTMLKAAGLEVPNASPLLHFASRVDVIVWDGEEVDKHTPV